MTLILAVLVGFPLGFLLRSRTSALIAYIALHAFLFTFQSLELLLEWVGGDPAAFGPFPRFDNAQTLGYGAVNLGFYALGLGLLVLGSRVARRRRGTRAVDLDAARA